jgi:hypothetical protein
MGGHIQRSKNLPVRIKSEFLTGDRERIHAVHEDKIWRMDSNCLWHERQLVLFHDELCLTPLNDELIIEKIPLVGIAS